MLQFCVFLLSAFVLGAASLPYYSSSVIETPTSRVVQHLMLSPQLHQSYRIHPEQVHTYSHFNAHQPQEQEHHRPYAPTEQQIYAQPHEQHQSHQQVVYYYQNQQPSNPNVHQPSLNLYNLRQDMPWWQGYWNQFVGQGFGEEEEQQPEEEEGSLGELFEDNKNKPNLEAETTTAQPRLDEGESNKIAPKEEIAATTQTAPIEEQTVASQPEHDEPDYSEPSQLLHRYYVLDGPPEFYGKIDQQSMVVSLQQLQPVVRTSDNEDSVEEKIVDPTQPITTTFETTTTSAPESSTSLRIHVADEFDDEDQAEEEKNITVSARSRLPSDDQNTKASEEDGDEEKKSSRDQLNTEGRELSDDSSIAQAKPSAIAIAGNGGVASAKPVANAISGPSGLSVASPSATAIAGDFSFSDDDDRKQQKPAPRRPQKKDPLS